MKFLGFNITRGTSIGADFVPYDNKGNILTMSGFGKTSDFSNITTPIGQAIAYQAVRPIRMLINRRASSFGNGKVWILDRKENEINSTEAKQARELLKNPNPLQTWNEFYLQQKVFKYVFGFCPVYALRPIGMKEPIALYNIFPLIFKPEYTGRLYQQTKIEDIVKSYKISYGGLESELKIEDVYISKDISQSMTIGEFLPESRLGTLRYEAALSNALGDAKYTIVSKRGAIGILSDETKENSAAIPLTNTEKQIIQEEYRRYGLSHTQNQIIITSANLKWQQMGISVRELMLLELGDDANMKIADTYDYPYELLGNTKGVTFANKNEAKKQFYQDVVIPEAESDSQALTTFLGLQNCHVEIDFSEVSIMQEDKKLSAETLNTTISALSTALSANAITIDEYRIELSKLIDIDPNNIPEQNATTESTETEQGTNQANQTE